MIAVRNTAAALKRFPLLGLGLGLGLAILLWLLTPSASSAFGYWTCAGASWVAVGKPDYPMPIKTCGSKLEIPGMQEACEKVGGRWGPAGLFPRPICRMPTRDGGRLCGDTGECEGYCLAALTRAQFDLVMRWRGGQQKLPILGKCTPHVPVFGCMAIVRQGVVTGIMCRD